MNAETDPQALHLCLPAAMRTADTTITRVAAGLSGAGVYQVRTRDGVFVLKLTSHTDPFDTWQRRVHIQKLAGETEAAPRVVHVDEEHRAVLTTFVEDHSFPALYGDPSTRQKAIALLAETLRIVHAMDPHNAASGLTPEAFLADVWSDLSSHIDPPDFVCDVIHRVQNLERPSITSFVLCHNDVNPTNIIYDGTRVLLLDWDSAAPGSAYYDLAAASMFFRMSDPEILALIAAHDGRVSSEVPAELRYNKALVAALCGANFLRLAAMAGYSASVTRDSIMSMGEVYARMQRGEISIATAEGKWTFGAALIAAAGGYM